MLPARQQPLTAPVHRMIETAVAQCVQDIVARIVDANAGDNDEVRMRKRLRGDALVTDGADVIDMMNEELGAEQRKGAALAARVQALEGRIKSLEQEICDARGTPVTEAIYNDLLTHAPYIWKRQHPEVWIRFNLNSATNKTYIEGENPMEEWGWDWETIRDCEEINIADANAGARAVRTTIERGLDYRCRSNVYAGLDPFHLEEDAMIKFYVLWNDA